MSTLSTNKILICIYTCEKDIDSLNKLKDTNWYKDVSINSNNRILNIFADPLINKKYILQGNCLKLNTQESYNNLCIKTYKMLEACRELFDFDYLLKIDSNIIENRHNKTSHLFSFEYFIHKYYNTGVIGEYNGLTPIMGNTVKQFKSWANSKKLSVMPESLLSKLGANKWPMNYWAGGCYCLGKKSIDKILKQKNLFLDFKNLMGGCEDMAVASALI